MKLREADFIREKVKGKSMKTKFLNHRFLDRPHQKSVK